MKFIYFARRSADLMRDNRYAIALIMVLATSLGALSPEEGMGVGMFLISGGFVGLLTWATAAGTLFNTYTAAKTVINSTNLVQLPPNYLFVGKKFRITVSGAISNIVTTPGLISFNVMMGAIVAWTSGALQLNATAHTLLPFKLVVELRVDTIGSGVAAKYLGMGWLSGVMFTRSAAQVDNVNIGSDMPVPATAPAVGTGFDSTIANILDFWVGFSINNAGNGVQIYDYIVEDMN